MLKQKVGLFFSLLLVAIISFAQQSEVVKNYIYTYKELAVAEMKRTGVPAAITLAQGIHESGAGQSWLVKQSNNHFGIKCKSNWTGEAVYHDDDARQECFRKYPTANDSYKDHSDFLKNGQRYAFLFQLDPEDYSAWAHGLKKAGYATNPKYPQILIKTIEEYGLQHYSMIGLGKIPDKANEMTGGPVAEETAAQNNTTSAPVDPAAPVTMPAETKPNYPEGVFMINETKVMFIKKGQSFLSIAKQHKVDLSKLFEFNELYRTEVSDKDQLLYLQRKRKTGADEFHIVKKGETLSDIAQVQGIRLESLKELNWLRNGEMPAIGEKLSLKKKSATIPKLNVRENYSIIKKTN
jgi:LysM repeat protein